MRDDSPWDANGFRLKKNISIWPNVRRKTDEKTLITVATRLLWYVRLEELDTKGIQNRYLRANFEEIGSKPD